MMSIVWKPRAFGIIALVVFTGLGALATRTGEAGAGQSSGQADPALNGAIDIHAHIDPDSFGPNSNQAARSIDVIDLAKLAKERGMRGFVAKQHYDQTAHVAYLVRKAVPGIEVFGLLGSNRAMGGVNPAAVQHFA